MLNPVFASESTPVPKPSFVKRQGLTTAGVAAVSVMLVGLLWLVLPQLFGSWELATHDLRSRWQGAASVDDDIVIISRDEASDKRFGMGVWDRAVFAKVIAALGKAGARTVSLDFHMPDASPPERGSAASDRDLVTAVVSSGTVVSPVAVLAGAVEEASQLMFPDALTRLIPPFMPDVVRVLPQAGRVEGPFPALAAAVAGLGHIAAWPDSDGVYRRVPTFVGVGERAVPALGVAMAANFLQVSPDHIELVPGKALRFHDAHFPDGRVKTLSLPVDGEGRLLIRYAGRWNETQFHNFPFLQVWNAIQDKKDGEATLQETFRGKLVVLFHAALGSDKRRTPYEVGVPGGYIILNVANTIVKEHALREIAVPVGWLLAFLLGLGAVAAMTMLPGWLGLFVAGSLGLFYTAVSFLAMPFGGLVLPVLSPLATLVVASLLTLTWSHREVTDRVMQLRREELALHRVLATKQLLLAQQEAEVDRLEDDVVAARTEVESKEDRQAVLERTITTLQQALQTKQREVDDTRKLVNSLEGKLVAMQVSKPIQSMIADDELERLRQECAHDDIGILTRDPVVLRCWKDLKLVARSLRMIMILGEPGTGKELFAKAVHRLSDRAAEPFVAVNMAAVPSDLFESEFFGHLRGSFTGAVRDHKGYFLQAHNGTIFLDEIGDLRLDLQAKLLRVLQEGVVTRVGEHKPIPVNVRVVSATNRNLLKGVAEEWFRQDLYDRLHGIELHLPPLRERQGDVPELAQRFIERLVANESRRPISLSQGAMERLKAWPWKGNIRELKRCMENAVTLAQGPLIMEEDLRLGGAPVAHPGPIVQPGGSPEGGDDPRKSDPALLQRLREHSFDLQATAATLGWDRSTVMQRLKGMCFESLVQMEGDESKVAAGMAGDLGLTRLVAVKLKEYVEHLQKIVATYPSQEAALVGCKKRFKNLPERYHAALTELIRSRY